MGLFDYPDELETIKLIKRQKRREYMEKWLGRPLGTWGGVRPNSGRPRDPNAKRVKAVGFRLNLTSLEQKLLTDMGNGNIYEGLKACIKEQLNK